MGKKIGAALPLHVAIIPDGNRRWARAHGKSVLEGHQAGVRIFKDVARYAADRGIKHLSLWGMSLDNLSKRSVKEVAGLLRIFRTEFQKMALDGEIHERQTRVNVFGRWREKFPMPVKKAIERAVNATAHYDCYWLNFFLAYNGTDEMLCAVRGVVKQARQSRLRITPRVLKQHLLTRDLPPVDLLIRTAGEPHLSAGFMMWDMADAQLYFTDTYWPAFTEESFDEALTEYARRGRRLGS